MVTMHIFLKAIKQIVKRTRVWNAPYLVVWEVKGDEVSALQKDLSACHIKTSAES